MISHRVRVVRCDGQWFAYFRRWTGVRGPWGLADTRSEAVADLWVAYEEWLRLGDEETSMVEQAEKGFGLFVGFALGLGSVGAVVWSVVWIAGALW